MALSTTQHDPTTVKVVPAIRSLTPLRFWLGLVPAMVLPLLLALFYFVWMGESPAAKAIYGAAKVFTLLWPLFCVWLLWKLPLPEVLRIPDNPRSVLLVGLTTGLAICGIMAIAMQTPLADGVWAGAERILAKTRSFGVLDHYWLFGAYVTILHSLVEEYYWRWFVFGKLHQRIRPLYAYLLAAAAFTAHHVVVLSQYFDWPLVALFSLSVGVGGLLWSWMLVRQRTLWGAWLSHALVDFGIFVIGYRLIFEQ